MSKKNSIKNVVEQYFERRAKYYPDYYTRDEILPWERKYFDSLEKGARVLDLCCGGGRTATFLAKKGFDMVGIDIVKGMLIIARQRAKMSKVAVNLVVGDATNLPLKDCAFEHIIYPGNSLNNLASLRARSQSLLEMARVLKGGGTFFIQTNYILQLKKLIWRTAGFVIKLPVRAWKSLIREDCTGLYFGDSFYGTDRKLKIKGFSHALLKRELGRYMELAKLEYKIETDREYMGDKSFKAKFSQCLVAVGHKN